MSNSTVETEEIAGTESIYERIDKLNALSRRDKDCDCKRALSLAVEALELSKDNNYEKGLAQSLVSKCYAYERMSECDKSLACIFEALPLLQKIGDKQDEAKALNLAGIDYLFYARLDQALEYFNRSMKLAEEIGDKFLVSITLNNIGEIYNEMNKYDEAMESYKRSYKLDLKVKNMESTSYAQANMGQVSFKLGHYTEALKYYRQSLTKAWKLNDKIYIAYILNSMGEVYNKLGLPKKAMGFYTKSLRIFEEQGEKFYQTDVHINFGLLYSDNGQYDKAFKCLKTALSIAEGNSAKKKVYIIHSHLSNLYEKTGDYQNALYHYRLHHELEKDVSCEEVERQLHIEKTKYKIEEAQKEAEIYKLKNTELRKKADEVQKKACELEESYKNIKVISEIGQKITSTFNFTRIFNTVYRNLNTLMDADCFGIAFYKEFENVLEFKLCIEGSKNITVEPISMEDSGRVAVCCVKNRKEICINDFEAEHERYIDRDETADDPNGLKSVIYCPLMVESKVIGVITVQSYNKNAYTQSDLNTVKALGSYIAVALNNSRKSQEVKEKAAQLAAVNSRLSIEISKRKTAQKSLEEANKKLKDMLSIDALTGIFNRRGFEQFLRLEWRRSVREGIPLSIILIDIDFFKQYNDRHGHLAGDACLKKVSNALLSDLKRPMDFIARYGGEEFIVILPNTEADGAAAMAERMREGVESLNIVHGRSTVSPYITISSGVSTIVPNRRNSRKEFINSADRALYKAKQEGRNRVCPYLKG